MGVLPGSCSSPAGQYRWEETGRGRAQAVPSEVVGPSVRNELPTVTPPHWAALTAVPWFLALLCVCGRGVVVVPVARRGIVWKIQVGGHLLRRAHISLQPIMSCYNTRQDDVL